MDPVFFELHAGLAREGPGSAADTLRALALTGLAGRVRVLDVGCGPGAASLALLEALPEAEVTALDLHVPFLVDAAVAAAEAGHAARLRVVAADMGGLSFPAASFELIWSEGAAYIQGIPAALATWQPLVADGGRIAFSEAVWLTGDPGAAARSCWAGYPAMTDVAGVRAQVAAAGYRLIGDFVLSDAAWDAYYQPLERRVAALETLRGVDHPVLVAARAETAARRTHGSDYGYAFFVAER